jgi:hypothetical protein
MCSGTELNVWQALAESKQHYISTKASKVYPEPAALVKIYNKEVPNDILKILAIMVA